MGLESKENASFLQSAWHKAVSLLSNTYTAIKKDLYNLPMLKAGGKTYEFRENAIIRQITHRPGDHWTSRITAKDINLDARTYTPARMEYVAVRGGSAESWVMYENDVRPLKVRAAELEVIKESGVKLAHQIIDDYMGYSASSSDTSDRYHDRLYRDAVEFVDKYGAEVDAKNTAHHGQSIQSMNRSQFSGRKP